MTPDARVRGGWKPDSLGPPNRPGYLKSSDAGSVAPTLTAAQRHRDDEQ